MQHLVRGVEHALQVGRVALHERHLLGEPLERNPPGDASLLARDLEQAIEPARDG